MAIDTRQDIRIAHSGGFYQVHTTPEELLQFRFDTKKLRKTGVCVGCKLHQKISITVNWIEIFGARS